MLLPKSKFYTKVLVIAGTSLCLEIAQYVLAVGRTDITDLITNTAGGFFGTCPLWYRESTIKRQGENG